MRILSDKKFPNEKIKVNLINLISKTSGHSGIAGGQYVSDLSFENKKIPLKKIKYMQIKKTYIIIYFLLLWHLYITFKVR